MRLSTTIKKNIVEASVGAILNRVKLLKRRNVGFFDEVFYDYIKFCESHNSEVLYRVGRKWMHLYFSVLVPKGFKTLSPLFFLNRVMRYVWLVMGMLEDFEAEKEENIIKIKTKREKVTRVIGKNMFLPGLYQGTLETLYGRHCNIIKVTQRKNKCVYEFEITEAPLRVRAKDFSLYLKLNEIKDRKLAGVSLREALEKNIFQLRDNTIYFRNKSISLVENTLFHLIGIENFSLEFLRDRCREFFEEILENNGNKESKMKFLKFSLEVLGWGYVSIMIGSGNKTKLTLKSPPYGLQLEKDNWVFIARCIEGYLSTIRRNTSLKEIKESEKKVTFLYG